MCFHERILYSSILVVGGAKKGDVAVHLFVGVLATSTPPSRPVIDTYLLLSGKHPSQYLRLQRSRYQVISVWGVWKIIPTLPGFPWVYHSPVLRLVPKRSYLRSTTNELITSMHTDFPLILNHMSQDFTRDNGLEVAQLEHQRFVSFGSGEGILR